MLAYKDGNDQNKKHRIPENNININNCFVPHESTFKQIGNGFFSFMYNAMDGAEKPCFDLLSKKFLKGEIYA